MMMMMKMFTWRNFQLIGPLEENLEAQNRFILVPLQNLL